MSAGTMFDRIGNCHDHCKYEPLLFSILSVLTKENNKFWCLMRMRTRGRQQIPGSNIEYSLDTNLRTECIAAVPDGEPLRLLQVFDNGLTSSLRRISLFDPAWTHQSVSTGLLLLIALCLVSPYVTQCGSAHTSNS